MKLAILLEKIKNSPETVEFDDVIACINTNYHYTPAAFKNGDTENVSGSNEGSCKIFSFAKLNALSEQETLTCFGKYYRQDVLLHPEAKDHANIRNFIVNGWAGITFDSEALTR